MAQDYTQGDYGTLPADTTNLKNAFAAGDYTAVSAVDAVYASQGMNDMYGIQMF
jgi:hypothetical protein